MQSLESRLLLAANLTDGVLTVTGTTGDDQVLVRAKASSVLVTLNGQTTAFARTAVERVGGPGRDDLYGRAGGDFLCGTAGRDRLFGGAGDDAASAGRRDARDGVERFYDASDDVLLDAFDPELGVYQNGGGETVVQVRFNYGDLGHNAGWSDVRKQGAAPLFSVDAVSLHNGAPLATPLMRTREFNLGHLTPGEFHTVFVTGYDGTTRLMHFTSASRNPLPPGINEN